MSAAIDRLPERLRVQVEVGPAPEHWLVHVKSTSVSVAVDTFTVYTFDREGRSWSAYVNGVHYRRGLDGRVRAHPSSEVGGVRHWLTPTEGQALWEAVRERLSGLAQGLATGVARLCPPAPGRGDGEAAELTAWLERLLAWDRHRLAADAEAFRQLYTSVPILPPDQYSALVVQVTTGCPWNRCTFCDFYRDRPYTVRTPADLDQHLARVRSFFGQGLRARRNLFLGDANLLSVPPARLLPLVERVRDRFPEEPLSRLFAFGDVLMTQRHRDADLRRLAELGLRRVYLGIESGSPAVRALLGKAGSRADAVRAVHRLRQCGIAAGAIVLLGAGGAGLAADHEGETEGLLKALDLGADDVVFFSPLVVDPDGEYGARLATAKLGVLTQAQLARQQARLDAALAPRAGGGPRRAPYDIDDFVF